MYDNHSRVIALFFLLFSVVKTNARAVANNDVEPAGNAQISVLRDKAQLIYMQKSNGALIRFTGRAAENLHYQFMKNYKFKVKGIVDGKDISCLKNKGPQNEFVCAFVINTKAQVKNVFYPKPESTELTLAQLLLTSQKVSGEHLKSRQFRNEGFRDLSLKYKGSVDLLTPSMTTKRFKITGPLAAFLYNHTVPRQNASKSLRTPAKVSGSLALEQNLSCKRWTLTQSLALKKAKRGSKSKPVYGYECSLSFNKQGKAI